MMSGACRLLHFFLFHVIPNKIKLWSSPDSVVPNLFSPYVTVASYDNELCASAQSVWYHAKCPILTTSLHAILLCFLSHVNADVPVSQAANGHPEFQVYWSVPDNGGKNCLLDETYILVKKEESTVHASSLFFLPQHWLCTPLTLFALTVIHSREYHCVQTWQEWAVLYWEAESQ